MLNQTVLISLMRKLGILTYIDICEKIHLCNNKNIINNIFPP